MVAQRLRGDGHKQVLILTADAGSGHRSAAQAIQAALQERYADRCLTAVINPMRMAGSPPFLQAVAEDHFDDLVQKDPALYELSYRMSDSITTAAIIDQVLSVLLYDTLKGIVDQYRPDAIVCTYPLFLEPLNFVFDRAGRSFPLISVITDLVTVHTLWFNPRVHLCLVPTRQARKKALRNGVPADRIHVTGMPVHPCFSAETRSQKEIRAQLGWLPDVPTALIVGGTRVAKAPEIARLIDRAGLKIQQAIVAGGDEAVYARLSAESWRGPTHIYGFASNMPALIRASDVVITKAGGLIVSETLACERPLIFCSAIPGQETGNVQYVTSAGAGDWAPSPAQVLASLVRWLARGGEMLAERTAHAARLGHPYAVYQVAELVWDMANSEPLPIHVEPNLRAAALFPLKAGVQVSRMLDKFEQDVRGLTDTEMARLAMWCVNQIERPSDLERVNRALRERMDRLVSG
jgi:1,2-diacylglycerol 3-beta-galactosyltransferase